MSWYVFICPKCQSQAQLWQPGHKTVACQKCGAKLQTDSLRFFGPFETQAEAVEKRSVLQAELSQTPGSLSASALTAPVDKEVLIKPIKVKKPQQIILDILKENGTMIVADCEFYCGERGVDGDDFHKILDKLIQAGEVYRPDKGLIALV
ncbi:hypothetical protein MmiEs2_12970 [Methanimicrococcus stummii]|uniref:DUF5817 domain-containing protein n=1 Tax=Methanimicrococcus stummii TaxID=3028294 RepID=A0AA96VA88_9EURY|nr:hypothetical protein [Methanimicrococcus sp. Es2]WNY29083.1 hypothetical protein MmiEs2_12970 [Methanimicrococcus sp. Es2]